MNSDQRIRILCAQSILRLLGSTACEEVPPDAVNLIRRSWQSKRSIARIWLKVAERGVPPFTDEKWIGVLRAVLLRSSAVCDIALASRANALALVCEARPTCSRRFRRGIRVGRPGARPRKGDDWSLVEARGGRLRVAKVSRAVGVYLAHGIRGNYSAECPPEAEQWMRYLVNPESPK